MIVHVEVTAEHIAAAGPWDIDNLDPVPGHKDPVELALIEATGRDSIIDEDGPGESIATIGQGQTTIVLNLPPAISTFCDTYYRGEPVEPFAFDLELEAWLVELVRDEQPYLTLREAASRLGVKASTLRQQAQDEWAGHLGPSARARRLRAVKLGRDWFVSRAAVELEAAR